MKLVKKGEGKPSSTAAKHFNQWSLRKINYADGESERIRFGFSHFLPNGGAEMAASSAERIYYGISGSMLVKDKNGKEYLVEAGDVLYIPPNEERSMEVVGSEPATLIVIIVKLD